MNKAKRRIAQDAIRKVAARDGVSVDYVREQMQFAMMQGLNSSDPMVKKYWESIPCEGDIPTPEEFILYMAEQQ